MNRPKGKKVNDTPFTSEDVQVDTRYANHDQSLDPDAVVVFFEAASIHGGSFKESKHH